MRIATKAIIEKVRVGTSANVYLVNATVTVKPVDPTVYRAPWSVKSTRLVLFVKSVNSVLSKKRILTVARNARARYLWATTVSRVSVGV